MAPSYVRRVSDRFYLPSRDDVSKVFNEKGRIRASSLYRSHELSMGAMLEILRKLHGRKASRRRLQAVLDDMVHAGLIYRRKLNRYFVYNFLRQYDDEYTPANEEYYMPTAEDIVKVLGSDTLSKSGILERLVADTGRYVSWHGTAELLTAMVDDGKLDTVPYGTKMKRYIRKG